MTKARKGKPKPDKTLKPKVNKETVKDLSADRKGDGVRGGAYQTRDCDGGGAGGATV